MKREATVLLVGASCCGAAAEQVRGQLEPPDLNRDERWVALRGRSRLEVRDIGWNTNVFDSIEATSTARGSR